MLHGAEALAKARLERLQSTIWLSRASCTDARPSQYTIMNLHLHSRSMSRCQRAWLMYSVMVFRLNSPRRHAGQTRLPRQTLTARKQNNHCHSRGHANPPVKSGAHLARSMHDMTASGKLQAGMLRYGPASCADIRGKLSEGDCLAIGALEGAARPFPWSKVPSPASAQVCIS